MQRTEILFLLRILVLITLGMGVGFLLAYHYYIPVVLLSVLLFVLAYHWLSRERILVKNIMDFSEAVKYRDFTRRFVVKHPRTLEGRLFIAFNQINAVYKEISIDKEVQYQYLNKVVNMLDSAIILYETGSGKVIWINDAFKQLFQTPHLGNMKGLRKKHPDLYERTLHMKVGKQQVESADSIFGNIKLLSHCSSFDTADGTFRIVVYQNISDAVSETETKAWQKLLRVLTHEIMNSIAPISSLAETLHERLKHGLEREDKEDLQLGIQTIKRRSEGLLHFAKSYRLINKVDTPRLANLQLKQIFENVYQLLEPTLIQRGIDLDIILKDTRLELRADGNLIEQVLINLLLNAMDAVRGQSSPYISLSASKRDEHILVIVQDNGVGMTGEIQDQIFTPFFTTKKSGSGVGLTLSKQIMMLHQGTLQVKSALDKGSTFLLQFPI